MNRVLTVICIAVVVIVLLCGCTDQKGLIVRHDITEDELDIFHVGITPDEIQQAFGLPHAKFKNGSVYTYEYWFDQGYIEICFKADLFYIDNYVNYGGEGFVPNVYMESSNSNIGKIIPGKYMIDIRKDIQEEELAFIDQTTTSAELQNMLGAPAGFEEYSEGEQENQIVTNAYFYQLADGDIFKVIYTNTGSVLKAWIEDTDGTEQKVLVGID